MNEQNDNLVRQLEAFSKLQPSESAMNSALERLHRTMQDRSVILKQRQSSIVPLIESKTASRGVLPRLQSLTIAQQMAAGGLGLTAAVLLVLAVLTIGSAKQASAMERMLEKLREVTSFRYTTNEKSTYIRPDTKQPRTIESNSTVWWQEPNSLREAGRIIEYDPTSPPEEREVKQLTRYECIVPSGNQGVVVDHAAKTILNVPEFDGRFGEFSPAATLRKVQEKAGAIVRDLGSKRISGKQATGFVMKLRDVPEGSGYDALEVWIDSKTDLPIEFSFELQKDNLSSSFRLYDCQWNIDFDKQLFEPTPPEGYTDTTTPQNEGEIEQLLEALRLYAELSEGHYPQVSQLDSKELKNEMLKLAGFTGPPQQAWLDDANYQRIEKAEPGLDWLRRITRDPHRVGYYGKTVTKQHKEKVLLWWGPVPQHSYQVVYGDLRTELVNIDRGKLGPNGFEFKTIAPEQE
jgi:outer membrane lipoprotein-sorting protein